MSLKRAPSSWWKWKLGSIAVETGLLPSTPKTESKLRQCCIWQREMPLGEWATSRPGKNFKIPKYFMPKFESCCQGYSWSRRARKDDPQPGQCWPHKGGGFYRSKLWCWWASTGHNELDWMVSSNVRWTSVYTILYSLVLDYTMI